jgi:hypothetical protein
VLTVAKFIQCVVRSENGHSGVEKNLVDGSAGTAWNSLRTSDEYDEKH